MEKALESSYHRRMRFLSSSNPMGIQIGKGSLQGTDFEMQVTIIQNNENSDIMYISIGLQMSRH